MYYRSAMCNVHCYRPDMREKIREVMRFSGPLMIFHHPMEALRYILTKQNETVKAPYSIEAGK